MKKINFKTILMTLMCVVGLGISPNAWAGNFVSNGSTKLYINNINGCGLGDSKWIVDGGVGWMYMEGSSSATSSYDTKALTHTSHDDVYYITITGGTYSSMYLKRGKSTSEKWNETGSISFGNNGENYLVGGYTSGGTGATWVYAADDALIYFDNSVAQWNDNRMMFLIGRSDYNSPYQMTNITNTKLYYYKIDWWANYTKYGVIGVGNSGWGAESSDISTRYTCATHHTKLAAHAFQNCTALLTYNSTSNNQDLTTTEISGYSALNKSIDIAAKVGGTVAATPGKLTASSYKFSAYNTCGTTTSATLNVGSTTTNCVVGYTAKTTLTATDADGYTFTGWYNGSTLVSLNKSVTVYPHGGETYYACYTENTYSITFDANGGSGEMASQTGLGCATDQTINANSFTAPTGYHFTGWNTAADGTGTAYAAGGTVEALTVTTQGGTLKLYAQWAPNTHTLTWDFGEGSTTDQNYTKAGTVAYGTSIEYPTDASMSYAGHNFTGWSPASPQTMPDEDLTITALWEEAASFKVTYAAPDKTSGDVPTDATEYTLDAQVTVFDAGNLARTGYDFAGWKNSVDEKIYSAGQKFNITSNTTLTAQWTAHTYTITYAGVEGATNLNSDKTTYTIEEGTYTLKAASKDNYTFEGWYDAETGGNQVTEITHGSYGDKTLWAHWSETPRTVTLTAGTGVQTFDPGTVTGKVVTTVTVTATPKIGYEWGTGSTWEKSGAGTIHLVGDGAALTNQSITFNVTGGNVTLTATATPKTYTISFDNNGGTGTVPAGVTATYAAAMPALQGFTAPVKNGYKFLGYEYNGTLYYGANGTSVCNWNVDDNVTLTAKWDRIHVYIEGKFRVRDGEGGTWKFPGSSASDYVKNSKTIEFAFDDEKNIYTLKTWAYADELIYSGQDLNFHIATWTSTDNFTQLESADCKPEDANFWFNKEHKSSKLTSSSGKNFWFKTEKDDNFDGPVILTYDPVANTLSYTAEPEQTYTVTFIAGGHGHLNEEGPRSVGVRSGYNITATADKGYHFVRFDKTGDVTVNATDNTANITVTGEGTVTATFAADTRVYFTKPGSWTGSDVYAYFDTYWSENKTSGDTYEGAGSKGKADGKKMEQVTGNVYAVSYSGNEAKSEIAFVNDKQNDHQAFDQTSVTYRPDFNRCSTKNWFDTENKKTGDYNKHDGKQTAYYNDGEWKSYQDMPVEFYMRNSLDWDKVCYDQCFKPTSDPNIYEMIWPVATLTGFNFKVWQTCDCWYGKQNTTINTDGQSINLECNTADGYNISFTPWKVGSYEFKLDISTMNLKVNFLDDIVVEDFPQEISVLNSRQYKITPNVRFFNNTKPQDITIEVTHSSGISGIATYTQSGTNLIVLGDATKTGQETVNVYYKKNSEIVQTRTLIVNVAQPITIQANMSGIAATETHWTNTNLVHVHFWGTNADKSQDAQMTYNETEKVYSVTVPKILGTNEKFNFIIWYGESLNMLGSDNAKWRQTANLATTGNTCYTMGAYTADNANRTATPGTVGTLCLPDVYQVEVYMKNGRTYTSNSVTANDEDKAMSFFAPKDNDESYSGGKVYLLNNGTIVGNAITGFTTAGVYTATLTIPTEGNASLSDITAYNGDYYVIAGVSGSELNDDTKMHKFTPRENTTEDYSYYWTKYTGNCTDKNVIAKVANEYNSNLSLTIGADALTQADGKVEAGNVRFSYEPTTNAFKRAILGASNSDDFLNVYGNNVYADAAATQLLDKNQSLNLSKFADNSDWVYEKVVYVKVDNEESESKVTLKSVFNGQTSHLLGYEIDETTGEEKKDSPNQLTVLGKGSTTGNEAYAIRISYDFKKNRLISSWEPTEGEYKSDMSINSDILFIRTEDGNVQQVQVATKSETESYKISSLQHVMFVMEIDGSTDQTSYSQYWISLPFDCQISDIFGVEGYITLDENRIAQKGTWGIMRYRGDLRAQKGWFKETDGFWEWMYENETMYAGEGYVLFFERESITSWPTIKVGDEEKTLKRLYFPSKDAGFEMTNTVDEAHSKFECKSMRCTIKTPEDREAYDSNWRVIGPKSYNNIKAKEITADGSYGDQTVFPKFLYTYNVKAESGHKYEVQDGMTFNYQSFHAYMVQYEGTITWKPYTQTTPATVAAHYVEDPNFKGGTLTIELMQNNEQLDRAFVKLDEKGTAGYDFSQDLTKITENCAQIASVSEDVLYAGNTLPLDIELVPLNVKVVANGTYDIALSESLNGLEVRLYDAFEQTTTPLDMMSATVTLEKGEYKDRFFLQFVQKSPLTPTNLNGAIEQFNLPTDKTQKLLINSNIYLINAGRIYNASGTQVK